MRMCRTTNSRISHIGTWCGSIHMYKIVGEPTSLAIPYTPCNMTTHTTVPIPIMTLCTIPLLWTSRSTVGKIMSTSIITVIGHVTSIYRLRII
eukprot:UN19571